MNIREAADLIRSGGVVAFPTETVYGLGADAWNPDAIRKVFELKERPSDNPLIVHVSALSQVELFAQVIPDSALSFMERCWPGPLTLIFEKKPEVPDLVSGGLPTVALRMPDHPVARELIHRAGPLVAPSANRSGRPSPTKPEHVREDFGTALPLLEGGSTEIGIESTVLDLTSIPFRILRPGSWTAEQLTAATGIRVVREELIGDTTGSPGLRYTHYRPDARVEWFEKGTGVKRDQVLLLTHTSTCNGFPYHRHYRGNFNRMAQELYDRFRLADRNRLSYVLIERLPSDNIHPIIAALRNRIEKAIGQEQC